MSINFKRGLFRAWVGTSLLWAVPAGFIVADQYQALTKPVEFKVKDFTLLLPAEMAPDKVREAISGFIKWKNISKTPDIDAAEIAAAYKKRDFARGYLQMAGVLFGPPFALFLLGSLLIWIFSGFISNKHPSQI